jgi:hypothetical protein
MITKLIKRFFSRDVGKKLGDVVTGNSAQTTMNSVGDKIEEEITKRDKKETNIQSGSRDVIDHNEKSEEISIEKGNKDDFDLMKAADRVTAGDIRTDTELKDLEEAEKRSFFKKEGLGKELGSL